MAHWKAELAAAEAAEWKRLNAGWDKGMPAEVEGVKLVGRPPKARNAAGAHEPAWWEMAGGRNGAGAPAGQVLLGLSPWAPGWERWYGWGVPAEEWGVVERMGPRKLEMPDVVPPREGRRERGGWGEPAGAAWPLPVMKQVEVEPSREAARVLRMPQGQKLKPCTWALGAELKQERKQDALAALAAEENAAWLAGGEMPRWHGEWKAGLKKAGWQERLRQEVAMAQMSLGYAQGAEARVQELAQGHVRPLKLEGLADAAVADVKPSPLERMAAQEELAWLLKALSPRQREAVVLKAEGLSMREAAAEMGCSHVAVSKLQKKAEAALRAALA